MSRSIELALVGPVPLSPFLSAGCSAVSVWREMTLTSSPERFDRAGERLGLPRNIPPLVRCTAGFLESAGTERVVLPSEGVLADYRAVLTALTARPRLDLLEVRAGNPAACDEGLRRLLPAWEGHPSEQGLAEAIPEDGAREDGAAVDGGLILLGPTPLFTDLRQRLEAAGVDVQYDEWTSEVMGAIQAEDAAAALAARADFGASVREGRLHVSLAQGARAVILVMEAFSADLLEEIRLRRSLNCPLLGLEVERPGPMPAKMLNRLDSFLELVESR